MKRKTPFDWLIVGLGNPGKEYARTRHNVGQEVVAELARRRGDTLKSGRDNALVAESRIGTGADEVRAVLAFPLTYMNESGQAVRALVPDYQLSLAIGKEGQNARLAAKLTGARIDIQPDSVLDE